MNILEKGIDFRKLFESAPGLYLVLLPDEKFTIVALSDAYAEAMMTKREEITGKGLFEVAVRKTEIDLSALRESLNSVLKNKTLHAMAGQKYGIHRPDGMFEERHLSLMNKPILNSRKEVVCIIHTMADVTDAVLSEKNAIAEMKLIRKELDEQSSYIKKNEKRLNEIINILLKYTLMDFSEKISVSGEGDELDAIIVGISTLSEEIVNHIRQIEDSNNQLASVNKELESFTYSVSHDLRSPLRAIDGYANIIREDYNHLLDEEGRRLLGVIQYNAKKMGELIDDLLAFSRLGRKDIQKSMVNMKELCEGIMVDFNKTIEHHARVKIGKLHPVRADYVLITQVLVNLISNAIKYSSKTQNPLIEITSVQKGEEVIYSIKDNGTGFDMKYVHKLFGVFQRLHKQGEFEGTGVGLAIVQRIVDKHRGRVWAEGQPGIGATFNFSLPVN